jgi:hypothetical protein
MAEPITAVITGLVSLIKGYMTYRNEKAKIEQEGSQAPSQAELHEGEQALQTVEAGVKQHGGGTEQQTLDLFKQQPGVFQKPLADVLLQLADQKPDFAALLRKTQEELPTLRQRMRGENLRHVEQRIAGKHGDHEQDMQADKDIEGGSQIIT